MIYDELIKIVQILILAFIVLGLIIMFLPERKKKRVKTIPVMVVKRILD